MTRQLRTVQRLAREFGCGLEQGTKHLRVFSPRGRLLFVVSKTHGPDRVPGGDRALRARFIRELRRVGEQVA